MADGYFVSLGVETVADDTPYVLVDLSDNTNFPHEETNAVHLLSLICHAEKATDGVHDIWVGVVTECDATDGSVDWVHVFHLEAVGNPTDSTDRFAQQLDFTLGGRNPQGVNCLVSGGVTPHLATAQTQANNVNWQNDTNRTSPVGATTKPGAGDLVVWVEEVSGSGTIDFIVSAIYDVE